MENNELIVGEVYYTWDLNGGWWAIGKHIGGRFSVRESGEINDSADILTSKGEFNRGRHWCYKAKDREYRVARYNEVVWLEACIREGRYISEEASILYSYNYSIY